MHSNHLRLLCLLVMAMLAAACGNDGADSAAGGSPAQGPRGQAKDTAAEDDLDALTLADAQKQTADMVRGVSPGKATAPIDLKFSIAARPTLGVPLDIDVAVIATGHNDSMTLSVQGGGGIEVDSSTSLASFPKSLPGSLYRHKLRVTPRAEGAFNVNVLVTAAVPGSGAQSRNFSIPVLVGGLAALDKPREAGDKGN
ncbi:MAG: hypothetical protein ACRET4_00020 [Steroidobacteraceae bacterium]